MWSILDGNVMTRRRTGGRSARHKCDGCDAQTDFHECEVSTPTDREDLPRGQCLMACDECGAEYATDELGAREDIETEEFGEEAVGEGASRRSSIALGPRRGDELARSSGGAAMGGSGSRRPGILGRLARLIKGRAGAVIERTIDPAKEIDQLVLDMEAEMRKARAETTGVMATRKLAAARIVDLDRDLKLWNERADQAVRAHDDELARLALTRRTEIDQKLAEAKGEEGEAAAEAERLQSSLKAIEGKLKSIKLRKGTIKAKVQGQRGAEVRANAFDEFDRMAGRVDDSESAVEAEAELASEGRTEEKDAHVARKFAALERKGGPSSEIEDRLAALKKKMEK